MTDDPVHPKVFRFPIVLTDHVFDKVRSIDMTLAEFREVLRSGMVIEVTVIAEAGQKELALDWVRPLHVVVVVDEERREERIVTVYEPDPARWSPDFRRRR